MLIMYTLTIQCMVGRNYQIVNANATLPWFCNPTAVYNSDAGAISFYTAMLTLCWVGVYAMIFGLCTRRVV